MAEKRKIGIWKSTHLSDLFDFGAALADEGTTLTGRDDQPQRNWRLTSDCAIRHKSSQVLEGQT